MNMTFFEPTEQEKQLIAIGRDMMDFSEEYGKIHGLKAVTDDGLRTLNNLSHVGNMLTHYGAPYGTKQKDFSEADMELISNFMQKKVDIERK
jgi:hypothetical protein